jgi:nitroimidazol reductase NimA-like FMN-containing flavoprotein (pyridoxamine 5'-phosphate oxidase superfamily)
MNELTLAECEGLLLRTPIGRLGFTFGGEQSILPINYRFVDGQIVFRTSTGHKLHAIAGREKVAFEVDRWDRETRTGWSVLAIGPAEEIQDYEEFEKVEALGLRPWTNDPNQNRWVRIVPDKITGRRIS